MVVESTKVVPGQENRRGTPIRPLHNGVDFIDGPILPIAGCIIWMFGPFIRASKPSHRGKVPGQRIVVEQILVRNSVGPVWTESDGLDVVVDIPLIP